MKCPACGEGFRTGTTVTLLDPAAGPGGRRSRVCGRCAGRAHVVVAPRMQPVVKQETDSDTKDKVARVLRQLRTLAKAAEAQEKAETPGSPDACFSGGRAEGFSGAIEIVKREFGQ